MHNLECQKHLKDFLPLTNKISELENQRRAVVSATVEDFIAVKAHIFRPLTKAHFKEHYYRECLVKSRRLPSSDISGKIMSLADFDVAKHPSEFLPVKYLPYELLKMERVPSTSLVLNSELEGFEKVEAEEINEEQRILVARVVDELTSVRSREVRWQVLGTEEALLEVG